MFIWTGVRLAWGLPVAAREGAHGRGDDKPLAKEQGPEQHAGARRHDAWLSVVIPRLGVGTRLVARPRREGLGAHHQESG